MQTLTNTYSHIHTGLAILGLYVLCSDPCYQAATAQLCAALAAMTLAVHPSKAQGEEHMNICQITYAHTHTTTYAHTHNTHTHSLARTHARVHTHTHTHTHTQHTHTHTHTHTDTNLLSRTHTDAHSRALAHMLSQEMRHK